MTAVGFAVRSSIIRRVCSRRHHDRRALRVSLVLLFIISSRLPASADVRDFLGRPITEVRLELGGMPFADASVLQLIETRVGEPLLMERVRETIDHLMGLGRFADVRVFAASAADRPDGVVLRWTLFPLQRAGQIAITGRTGLDPAALRAEITERFGAAPATSRVANIVDVLIAYYGERGYRSPSIQPRLTAGRAPELVTLVLAIDSGPQTTVGSASVRGDGVVPATVIAELRLEPGRPYDRSALDGRIAAFEEKLRQQGHYQAHVDVSAMFAEDGHTAHLTIEVERGARVRVRFAGDPLPQDQQEALVPIRQERSVDLDLLEDASRNIEAFLRRQGYRNADVSYVREEKGGEMLLTFTVSRGPLHRLASVEVVGNSAVAAADLAPMLQLHAGEPFVESQVSAITSAMTELYRVRGFTRAVVKPEISVVLGADSEAARDVSIRFHVTEGPPTTVSAVAIEGASAVAESRIRDLLTLTPGRPFYRPQLDADREAVMRLYHGEGFQDVRVEPSTTVRGDGINLDVLWTIDEGEQTIVDQVLVTGNVRTSADLIRREIVLQPGKPLGDEAMMESQRRLAALGLFRRVRIVALPHGASSTRDVLVEVEEAPSTTVSYGGGVEAGPRLRPAGEGLPAEERIEIAPRAFIELARRNLWGKNRTASLFTRVSLRPRDPSLTSTDPADRGGYGFNEYRVVGTFREPRVLDTAGDFQLTGFLDQAIRTSFNFARRGVRAEYGRRFGATLTISGRYAFDRTRLFDEKIGLGPEDQLRIDRLFPRVRLSTFTGSLLRDSRNDVLDPERGTVLGVDSTIAGRALGSEVGFAKWFGQAFAYRRLPGSARLTVAAGIRVGVAVGFARPVEVLGPDGQPIVAIVDDVPASERFFAGGDTTVRGFVLDRLGAAETLNDQGFPTGGNALTVMNVELRTPYWKGLGGVGFLDAGNVFRRAGDLRFNELRPAAGFGIRYRSPIGPVRVDLGFNLNRKELVSGVTERRTVFHISLGQAF